MTSTSLPGRPGVAEEVFLIVRGLSTDRSFRWIDWANAWRVVSPPSYWGSERRKPWNKRTLYSQVSSALKQQCRNGTVKRIDRGLYFFVQDRPSSPYYLPRR